LTKKQKKKQRTTAAAEITRVKMPNRKEGEMFARIVEILGNDRMRVFCEDKKYRIGRIRGKIKKRVWFRIGDLGLVNPYDWETESADKLGKCEIFWRYKANEIAWLERNNRIPEILDINNISF